MSSPLPVEFPPALGVFAEHRSIRYFLRDPLAPGDLDLIVEAGRRAPTDAQGHMYAFIRITTAELQAAYDAMSPKRDWYAAISGYFATGGTMEKREPVMARARARPTAGMMTRTKMSYAL